MTLEGIPLGKLSFSLRNWATCFETDYANVSLGNCTLICTVHSLQAWVNMTLCA